jgi:CDP-diacylglycerol--glycerol-3-phosphate 3-phosphatidyltransferase
VISVYLLKPKFQKALQPILSAQRGAGVTPNQLTVSAVVLSALIGAALWFAVDRRVLLVAVPIGLFFRMALNALDGMMASTYGMTSRWGELLNELGDALSDFLVFFPLLRFPFANRFLVAAFLAFMAMNELVGVLGKILVGKRLYQGPMGKSDRALALGVFCLVLWLAPKAAERYAEAVFAALLALLLVSTGIRIAKIRSGVR